MLPEQAADGVRVRLAFPGETRRVGMVRLLSSPLS